MNLARVLMEEVSKSRKSVVVIGDAMTDVWVRGQVGECQDGCIKITKRAVTCTDGGAANAYRCLSVWGVSRFLFAVRSDCRPLKYRFVGPRGIVFRYDDESMLSAPNDYGRIRSRAIDAVNRCDAVLMSDYDKGLLTPSFIEEVVGVCEGRRIPCVVDAKRDPSLYRGAILKCNREYTTTQSLLSTTFTGSHVVTFGEHPPYVNRERVNTGRAQPVPCVNHVGAGDCFAAVLAVGVAYGLSLKEAATVAHSAGRVYVQYENNRHPYPDEVVSDMDGWGL